eukprot:307633_1
METATQLIQQLVHQFEGINVSCANNSCNKQLNVSLDGECVINDRNKIEKYGVSIMKGYNNRSVRWIDTISDWDYYLSDNYDDNGIVFCHKCLDFLHPCFVCHKLDIGGPCTDSAFCDNCKQQQINHVCRRDHMNIVPKDSKIGDKLIGIFICKYCLKIQSEAKVYTPQHFAIANWREHNVSNRMCIDCWDNMEWQTDRLLWIANLKDDKNMSKFSQLPKSLICLIISFYKLQPLGNK